MNVEYTGRHYEVTSAIRKEVETGLAKIRKILGDRFEAKAILCVEKHRHKAEITINPRNGPLVGLAQAKDMMIAVSGALDHLEKQAVKYKTKWESKKAVCAQERRSKEVERSFSRAGSSHQSRSNGKDRRTSRCAPLSSRGQDHRGSPGPL